MFNKEYFQQVNGTFKLVLISYPHTCPGISSLQSSFSHVSDNSRFKLAIRVKCVFTGSCRVLFTSHATSVLSPRAQLLCSTASHLRSVCAAQPQLSSHCSPTRLRRNTQRKPLANVTGHTELTLLFKCLD